MLILGCNIVALKGNGNSLVLVKANVNEKITHETEQVL